MKQMKINVFEQIDKKIANNITSNYNDVKYFNIQTEENQYLYGILTLWDIRNKKMKQSSKLTINDKCDNTPNITLSMSFLRKSNILLVRFPFLFISYITDSILRDNSSFPLQLV